MRQLFEWDPLMEFIAAALKKDRLYRYADPMGALNLAVMGDGERLHWHFDQTDFVTSIALRPSEAGGDFEYVPLIRSATDENYPRVQRLLEGSSEDVVRVAMNPGTLLLFEGRNSIHRVTPISRTNDAAGRAARVRHQARNAEQQGAADGPLWPHRVARPRREDRADRFANGSSLHPGLASRKICWANARFPQTRFTEFTRSERSRTWDSRDESSQTIPTTFARWRQSKRPRHAPIAMRT